MPDFLPISMDDIRVRGWDNVDFICVTGDSYVDHPSFGVAIISRLLEKSGFRVAIIPQPVDDNDYTRFGQPLHGFWITGGNIDSMVSHYTAAKKRRSDDAYTAGNKSGKRPDRATSVYSRKIKALYPDSPVIIGGLEASFRRFAHYDYWDDAVRPSILVDSGADLLIYGMGERQTETIARRLASGEPAGEITDVHGTCFLGDRGLIPKDSVSCASFHKVSTDKTAFARAYALQAAEQDHLTGRAVVQKHGDVYLIQNSPMRPLNQDELDEVYRLPFMRMYHPSYEKLGGVKAIEEVEFSIMHNRGCFGGCNFCSIAFHQGRHVSARSGQSVLDEATLMTKSPRFKGYIHDIGGATANFRGPSCKKQLEHGMCRNRRCLAPKPCPNLIVDHTEYLDILRKARKLPGVKKVFVRSGLRYDYINLDPDNTFLREIVRHHVSGQLKVAPEHSCPNVLDYMGKPHISAFDTFRRNFAEETRKAGKEQYIVPYLMSSHPGATLRDAVSLAVYLKKNKIRPEQVQDFYPTPGTASTCMFYTGIDPFTGKPLYVARDAEEKALQRALLQYFMPKNRALVIKALLKAGRKDLIGNGPDCLISQQGARLVKETHTKAAGTSIGTRSHRQAGTSQNKARQRRG